MLSSTRKVLRETDEQPVGLIQIVGLSYLSIVPGRPLALADEAVLAASQAAAAESLSGSGSVGSVSMQQESSVPVSESSSVPASESVPPESSSMLEGGEPNPDAEGMAVAAVPNEPITEDDPPDPATAAESFAMMELLLDELNAVGLESIDWVNVADPLMLQFGWNGRVSVKLGARTGLPEKLAAAVVLLTNNEQGLGEDAHGTLDMSYYVTTRQSYFTPE